MAQTAVPVVMDKFASLVKQHELPTDMAWDLKNVLSNCDVVLVCDDSGSMQTTITEPNGITTTRWAELKKFAASMIEFVTAVNPSGMDIYFLNRGGVTGVKDRSGLQTVFSAPPTGSTYISSKINEIVSAKSSVSRNVLIVIATDGEPSEGVESLKWTLQGLRSNFYVSMCEFTQDSRTMDYLDDWDREISRFDNTDDYREELAKVQRLKGVDFKFTYDQYVVKILLAPFMSKYFNWDQPTFVGCGCAIM